jgi:hypothetical protein
MPTIFAVQSSIKLGNNMAEKIICVHPATRIIRACGCNICTICGHKWGGIKEADTHDSYGFPKPKGYVSSVGARHGS